MDVAGRIFALLQEQGVEQKKFAALVGVAPSKVSEWKLGKAKSYTKYLPQIAEALGTTVEYLLTGKQNSPTPEEGVELPAVWAKLSRENQEKALEYMQMLKALEEKR